MVSCCKSYRAVCDSGFTLLELLLSIFVFSIVITTVYGSYSTTFKNVQVTESQARNEEQARIILERLEADMESTYGGEGGLMEGEQVDKNGNRGDSISFTSTAHLRFDRKDTYAGITTLTYSTEENEETGLLSLYRLDSPLQVTDDDQVEEEKTGELLGENLKEFKLTYVNDEGDEEESWQSGSGEENEGQGTAEVILPVMIRIELRFGDPMDEESSRLFRTAVAILPGRLSGDEKK